ncbi:MAG: carboxypeptidase-like regulatory domain-containing protein [Flavobacteriales bacterium]|nr:carboxypeptidase-like regulatory domain-containing protein [Flavobacteriales bacterium]
MRKVIFTLLFAIALVTAGFASNGKTKVFKGQIIDPNGAPVIGAKVMVMGIEKSVYTDFDGEFIFPKVSSGDYEVSVSMVSFEERILTINLQASYQESFFITLEAK